MIKISFGNFFNSLAFSFLMLLFLTSCATTQPSGFDQSVGVKKEVVLTVGADLDQYLLESDEEKVAELERTLQKFSPAILSRSFQSLGPSKSSITGKFLDQKIVYESGEGKYSLFVPEHYSHEKPQPVVIILHGTGFSGAGYLDRWIPRLGSKFIIVCPTVSMGEWWTREAEGLVLSVLKDLMLSYRIDTHQILLGGMSSGGVGTFLIGLNNADLFAGFFPMAGAFPKSLFPLLDNLESTPMYILHGSKDGVMPAKFSRAVRDYMKENRLKVVYREHGFDHPQAGGHFFPEEETKALKRWLEKQKRKPVQTDLSMVRDRDHLGRHHWVRLKKVEKVASFWASYGDRSEGEAIKAGQFARVRGGLVGENRFEMTTEGVLEFEILLSPKEVDFGKPVVVKVNNIVRFEGMVEADSGVFLREARRWPDPKREVWAVLPISLEAK